MTDRRKVSGVCKVSPPCFKFLFVNYNLRGYHTNEIVRTMIVEAVDRYANRAQPLSYRQLAYASRISFLDQCIDIGEMYKFRSPPRPSSPTCPPGSAHNIHREDGDLPSPASPLVLPPEQ